MKHIKGVNENFFKKVGKFFDPDPIEVGNLDDTEKKYTEKQLFDLTEEAFKMGYIANSGYSGTENPDNISNNHIMNRHKTWWKNLLKKSSLLRPR